MNRKIYRLIITFAILTFTLWGNIVLSANIDPLLEKIDLSGFLRMRSWYMSSKVSVPGKFAPTDTYKQVNYQDMFFRNRLYLKLLPEIQIRTVFDISAKFGKSDFGMGSGSTNLITRDVYAVIRPFKYSELSGGLKPFSLNGGYILAADATGVQYDHAFFKKKVKINLGIIQAFDDADDSFGDASDPPKYADDNIFIVGTKLNLISDLTSEIYYVYENDEFTSGNSTSGDTRKSSLHWVGFHNKLVFSSFSVKFGGILNAGNVEIRQEDNSYKKTNIVSGLWEFDLGFKLMDININLVLEGATGDPNNTVSGSSFQDIKAAHSFSLIAVDSTGGIALRGAGESSWYGLYGTGIKLQYTLLDTVILKLDILHFGTLKEQTWSGEKSSWFGDEIDFKAQYKYKNMLTVFFTTGIFMPNDAYFAYANHSEGGVILEIMLGAQINY
ncbi:hypothetical protein ACFL20_06700 [Spirochaetota bacterium]